MPLAGKLPARGFLLSGKHCACGKPNAIMNYQQTLDYLYKRLPMFQRIGAAAFKKDLSNTYRLCEALGNPQEHFQSVHVAGTNGKGSVSHLIAACLQASGYRTGLYTSPHIHDFRERIRIDGLPVSEDFVVRFTEKIQPVIEEVAPSFFELTVAMAFAAFREQNVQVAVVEVGMGGRLDSTNILQPVLSVITNIGLDHMDFLGNTLAEIAREKAGIIKSNTPVMVGRHQEETHPVFLESAQRQSARMEYAMQRTRLDEVQDDPISGLHFLARFPRREEIWRDMRCALAGWVQHENAVTSLAALDLLRSCFPRLCEDSIRRGLAQVIRLTGLEGRWQIVDHAPLSIVDVAHNQDGLHALRRQAGALPAQKLHLVYGTSSDKPLGDLLPLLPKAQLYCCAAEVPRAMPVEQLYHTARAAGFDGAGYGSVAEAWETARQSAGEEDAVIACGSFFVAAEVLALYPVNDNK